MAQASRGCEQPSRLHGFALDERHVAVRRGRDDALRDTRSRPRRGTSAGLRRDPRRHRRPVAPRGARERARPACRGDARSARGPPRSRSSRRSRDGRVGVDARPCRRRGPFSRGHLTLVGSDDGWERRGRRRRRPGRRPRRHASARHDARSRRSSRSRSLRRRRLRPPLLVAAGRLRLVPRRAPRARLGRAAAAGPGVFGPSHGTATDIAGQGVADPSSMLLAAALMLGEGLGERGAAATLSAAVSHVLGNGAARAGRHRLDDAASSPTPCSRSCRSRTRTPSSSEAVVMRMNGADALLRSLEAEGVDVAVRASPAARSCRPTTRSPAARPSATCSPATSRARATWPRATRAPRAGSASPSPPPGPGATNLVTPIADAWMDSTPLVCITGQVRSHLIGTDAFQECDITGITMPIVKHSWLVQDVEELPHVMKAAFHVARTGRCGPVLVDIPRDVQEAELDFEYPDEVDLPGWRPAAKRATRGRSARRRRRSPRRERPVLYVGGGTINARRLRRAARARRGSGGCPVITTLMGKGAFPETHELHFGWPGMHGAEVVELGDEQVRRARRGRRALRRPRHRQALRVRARRDGGPPRHRRRRDREAPRTRTSPSSGR